MPQATKELQDRWMTKEDPTGDRTAEAYLNERGFILTDSWTWIVPHANEELTDDEYSAIAFLVYEWDYGDLASAEEITKYANSPVRGRNL